jgi:hypothetical protein
MKKIYLLALLIQALLTSCKFDTFDMYQETFDELFRNPKSIKITNSDKEVNNLDRCPILIDMGGWERYGKELYKDTWNRDRSWYNGKIIASGGVSLDFGQEDNSSYVQSQSNLIPIYIGPWHPITLTHTTGFFPFTKTHKQEKQIRFFAYTGIGGGEIKYQYESMTEQNKNIPQKEFSLPYGSAQYPPNPFDLCVVKWTAKFGYNAIAEVKSKNPFSKNYLIPTGKIIEARE